LHRRRHSSESKTSFSTIKLKDAHLKVVYAYHQPMEKLKEVVHCWKIESDDIDEDDPRGIQIKETEGEHVVEGKVEEMVV
jgi:hypothetical protein